MKLIDAFRLSPEAMSISTLDGWVFIEVNDSFSLLFGYGPEELIGISALDVGLWSEAKERLRFTGLVSEQGYVRDFETCFIKKNGVPIWIHISATAVDYGEKRCIFSQFFDVTGLKLVENALRQSEEKYRLISEKAGDVIWVLDPETLKFTYISPSVKNLRGYTPEEVMSGSIEEAFTPESYSGLLDKISGVIAAVESGNDEAGIRTDFLDQLHKDGSIVHTEAVSTFLTDKAGKVTQILGVTRDITMRVHAEEELRRSEARYRLLFDNMLEGFAYCRVIYDEKGEPLDWIYLAVNDAFERVTGLKDVDGKRATEVVPKIRETNPELFNIYGPAALKGGTEQFEVYIPSLKIWLRVSVFRPEEDCFVATLENITSRKISEKALKDSEENFRTLFETLPIGIVYQDETGLITRANQAAQRILGLSLDQMQGRTSMDPGWKAVHEDGTVFSGDDHPATVAFKTGKEVSDTVMGVFNPELGENRWINIKAVPQFREGQDRPYQVYTAFEDITGRMLAEEAARAANADYSEIFDNANDAIAVHDIETGMMIDVNRKMTEMFGYTLEEIVGMDVGAISMGEPSYSAQDAFEWVKKTVSEGPQLFEWRARDKSGRIFWIEVNLKRASLGGRDRVISISRDISERKLADEERRLHELKMQQVQRFESLGVLAGGIAHDFNNLLMVILGNIDLCIMALPDRESVVAKLKAAEKACLSAADLTKQMLAYAGRGQFVSKRLNLNEVISEIDMVLASSFSKKIKIRYELDADIPYMLADPGQVKQIVMNLVTNAYEAIGDGDGSISVVTFARDLREEMYAEDGDVLVADNFKPGRYIVLEVTDTGCGMNKNEIDRIFDPFFTTKFIGRGLGLPAVMGIVRKMGGAIKVFSNPGKGSIFTLYLPAYEDKEDIAVEGSGTPRGTVLLIDDEEDVLDIGAQMLRRLGYTVLTADNGLSALDVLRKQSVSARDGKISVSFVVLDMSMPLMSGEEAYEGIKKIDGGMPVFISSGYGEKDIAKRLTGKKIAGVLHKPYKFETLKAVISGYFGSGGS